MNAAEKRKFIRSLTKAVVQDLLAKVRQMPKEWDGIELRELLADKFAGETILSSRSYWNQEHSRRADKCRLREYRNEKLCRNL